MHHARYIIVLDRYDSDDGCGPDGHRPVTHAEGIRQVAAELQEAMDQTGEPTGFFNVIARFLPDRHVEGDRNVSQIEPAELRGSVATALLRDFA